MLIVWVMANSSVVWAASHVGRPPWKSQSHPLDDNIPSVAQLAGERNSRFVFLSAPPGDASFRIRHLAKERAACRARYEAGNSRAGLMPKAERVFRQLRSKMGRNPGSTALRTALAGAGLAISDRDSRWLAKQLPLSYKGKPKPISA
jgi:hypothetical protein